MAITVEAGSLSSITRIAANPPQQLQDYHSQHNQPLVLYIARVPGRRDVFLTPLKPRDRVVTAEDVQSSLYYVHINNEDDSDLVSKHTSAAEPGCLRDETLDPQQNPYTLSDVSYGHGAHTGPMITRKPLVKDITNSQSKQTHSPRYPPPLPPRPLPKLPDDTALQNEHDSTSLVHLLSPTLPMTPAEATAQEARTGALTLIRRDPATAAQWNVAAVQDQILHDQSSWGESSIFTNPARSKNRSLDIEITNQAYWSFTSERSTLLRSDNATSRSSTTFTRRLCTSQTGMDFDNPSRLSMDPERSSMSSEDRDRRRSVLSIPESMSTSRLTSRTGDLTFMSPWNGRCTFTTTAAGQSLKCLHHLPHLSQSHTVSELRFNLPHTSQQLPSKDGARTKRASRIGNMHHRFRSRDSDSHESIAETTQNYHRSEGADPGTMDLSLGQEQAGGGFGGRQAKLGKLIVYPDGLPMLDLLVAANMGLWWRAWDRTT